MEFQPPHGGVIVDRFLFIPDKYLERGGKLLLYFSLHVLTGLL